MKEAKVTTLRISGMHCASCALDIEKAIKRVPGVKDIRVNYASEQAALEYDPEVTNEQALRDAIQQLGYKAHSDESRLDEDDLERSLELANLKTKLIISALLTALLVIGAMVPAAPEFFKNKWLVLLLATPIQFWIGWGFYTSAWQALKRFSANMNTLIALGTSVAYGYSALVVFFEEFFKQTGVVTHLYFDASAGIITFIFLGNYLEARAKGRTSTAIKK